jgi:hypothetical protein
MKVKLKEPISGIAGSFEAGASPDLPDAMAKALVEGGHAEAVAGEEVIPAREEVIPDSEMIAVPENAMRSPPKSRRHGR